MKIDVYQAVSDPMLRIAVAAGAGLPPHLNAAEWTLMPSGSSHIIEDAAEDIDARGFSYYKLRMA